MFCILFLHMAHAEVFVPLQKFVLRPLYSGVRCYLLFLHLWPYLHPIAPSSSSSLLLQTTVSPNTDHCQKMLLPEQVKWGVSNTWGMFLTYLESVWPGYLDLHLKQI